VPIHVCGGCSHQPLLQAPVTRPSRLHDCNGAMLSIPAQIGLILVKELLQYKMSRDVPVCLLKMRSLPR